MGPSGSASVRSGASLGLAACLALGLVPGAAIANHGPFVKLHPGYSLMTLRPAGFSPQVSGLEFLPDGDLLVQTWRGNQGPRGPEDMSTGAAVPTVGVRDGEGKIYRLSGVGGTDRAAIKVTQVAGGFKDPMGLCVVGKDVYVGDIDRIVKLVDADGDGRYESSVEIGKLPSYDGWFEYSFGPVHRNGRLYMALAAGVASTGMPITQLGRDRASVVSLPIGGGTYSVVAEGLRAPDGIGLGPDGEIFVTDNQGGWRPASQLLHIVQDRFYGYMVEPKGAIQIKTGAKVTPPALWMPYVEANESPTEPGLLRAGAYAGQLVYGDVSHGGLYRAFLEKVAGEYQGAVFLLSGGLEVGVHRLRTGPAGEIYFGGLGNGMHNNQGWNETKFGLQKLTPNGAEVFDILAVRSRATGMEIEFTQAAGPGAESIDSYAVQQWGYLPTANYGGAKVDVAGRAIKSVQLSSDRRKAHLEMDGLKTGQVVQITVNKVKSLAKGDTLWYSKCWYTLNAISGSQPFEPVAIGNAADGATASPRLRIARTPGGIRVGLPDAGLYRVEVLDFQGRRVAENPSATGSIEIPIGKPGSGLHILRAERPGLSLSTPIVL